MININNSNDLFYRYKMEKVNIINKGSGNGLLTIINNLENIAKSINTPYEILYKYIATYLGSNYNEKKKSINGSHTQEKIQESIHKYINDFVICNVCNIPEINYLLCNNKIESKCSACGSLNEIKNNNKINQKNIDLILKYLQKNKVWSITKGNMVLQENKFFNKGNMVLQENKFFNKGNMVLQENKFFNKFNSEEFGKQIDIQIDKSNKSSNFDNSDNSDKSDDSDDSDNFNPF
jgi:translation initiation factor 2 beta subunit (eIF-2beta)/eIF-5